MRDTANRQEHSTLDRRPDGSIFFESDEPAFKLSEDELEKAEASQANRRRANFAARKPFIARTSHSLSLAPVEIKYTPGSSGFKVNKDGELELPSNAESVRTRGQLFEYCMHMFGRQPRKHLLAVHIYRNMVTLISMDRVAMTVATPFDYVKEPHKLLTFFYRLATSNRDSLGYDPSMVPASEDEIKSLKESLPSFDNPEALIRDEKAIYDAFSDVVTHGTFSIWPIYKVTVTDPDGSQHNFLVSKPCTDLPSLYGRGGKGYIAFDLGRKDFVFLKDSWRPDTDTITSEPAVYNIFKDKGLTAEDHLATMCCGGDVPDSDSSSVQRTRSQKRLSKRKPGHIHCRLVLNEIAHHMSNYLDTKNLFTVVLWALCGMFN